MPETWADQVAASGACGECGGKYLHTLDCPMVNGAFTMAKRKAKVTQPPVGGTIEDLILRVRQEVLTHMTAEVNRLEQYHSRVISAVQEAAKSSGTTPSDGGISITKVGELTTISIKDVARIHINNEGD